MQVLSPKVTGGWFTAECDDSVRYQIRDIDNRMQFWLIGNVTDKHGEVNGGELNYMLVKLMLTDIEGLQDDGEDFKPTFEKVKVCGEREDVIDKASMKRLPLELITNIALTVSEAIGGLNKEETADVNFTSNSSTESETDVPDATLTKLTVE